MSWLGPALSGAHPRTKGARCFTGGHRHRLPLTPKGLLVPRRVTRRQSTRGPIGADGTINDQGKAHGSVSSTSILLASEPSSAWRGTHTVIEGVARWESRKAAGLMPYNRIGLHGTGGIGHLRMPWVRCGAYAARCAWRWRIQRARCLCNRDNASMTRTDRSCRCVGAWPTHTAGTAGLGAP